LGSNVGLTNELSSCLEKDCSLTIVNKPKKKLRWLGGARVS